MEVVWNQISGDGTTPAAPGYHDALIQVDNLYVDGRKLADVPTFQVGEWKRAYIQE